MKTRLSTRLNTVLLSAVALAALAACGGSDDFLPILAEPTEQYVPPEPPSGYTAKAIQYAHKDMVSAANPLAVPGQLHLPPSLQPQQRFPVTGDAVSSFAATSQAAFEVLLVLTQQRQRELSDQREVARRMP